MPKLWIVNVRLPPPYHPDSENDYNGTWTVKCNNGLVTEVAKTRSNSQDHGVEEIQVVPDDSDSDVEVIDARESIMIPSLCHSHVHLDKCFILDQCGDLLIGDFKEAMDVTAKAKMQFPLNTIDLYTRGARLIEESVESGVTSMRAHVEVDMIVGFSCLDVALELKERYKDICDVQIAVFAQEGFFQDASDIQPGPNYAIFCDAAGRDGVSAVGSAPYVEPTVEQAKANIKLVFEAGAKGPRKHEDFDVVKHHIDFHLDYNLDSASEPLIYEVISQARLYFQTPSQPLQSRKTSLPHITIGHATRLQLLSSAEWHALREAMNGIPLTIVGLPQSDMFIQGRANTEDALGPPRSTLRVSYIEQHFGIKVAMAVNNVDNAFTPQGTLDPLSSLVSFGVAIFQAVTPREIRTLIEAVTLTSKRAIGLKTLSSAPTPISRSLQEESEHRTMQQCQTCQGTVVQVPVQGVPADLFPSSGDPADFVILHGNKNLRSVALHPAYERTTIKAGKIIAKRKKWSWLSSTQ